MTRTHQMDTTLFDVRNHHSATSGTPPHIDDARAREYLGYFENDYGEQGCFRL